jgi:Uma2 family endonuclease
MAIADSLMTAEEFGSTDDGGLLTELVRGKVVAMNMPGSLHGLICGNAYFILRQFADQYDLGRVLVNDTGVITERNPDTVRGADVAFYSYSRYPKGPLPQGYLGVAPEIVFEVRSPSDRWPRILQKVAEYLAAGVSAVLVIDPSSRSLHVYRVETPPRILAEKDELLLPELHPEFRVAVGRFLE